MGRTTEGRLYVAGKKRLYYLRYTVNGKDCRPTIGTGWKTNYNGFGSKESRCPSFTSLERDEQGRTDADVAERDSGRGGIRRTGTSASC